MSNELTVIEKNLRSVEPHFAEVLQSTGVPAERVIRTVMVSIERLPKIAQCNMQSIMNAAMSAAVLGLEVDGTTGQAYLIPFGQHCQLVIGYKGFNTLAARSGYTIRSGLVREGDKFVWTPVSGTVLHEPILGNKGRITGAWARAVSNTLPSVSVALSIEELMAVKNKSPGARKKDSPWNDPDIGFPAMCEKTVKRRLARSMPLNVMQYAAAMDEGFEERGAKTYIQDPDEGVVIEGLAEEVDPMGDREMPPEEPPVSVENLETPAYQIIGTDGVAHERGDIVTWEAAIRKGLAKMRSEEQITAFLLRNAENFLRIKDTHPKEVQGIEDECQRLKNEFQREPDL